jgi:Holliday junction resolvase
MELEEIGEKLIKGETIEKILEKFDWREFEKAVAGIFEANNFKVRQNFVFKTKRKYQIDILAVGERIVLCVDCKRWSMGRYKKAGLKNAAKIQEERVSELINFLRKNLFAKQMLKIKAQKFYSLVVTLFEEDLFEENKTFFVPVWKLNSFLLDMEKFF